MPQPAPVGLVDLSIGMVFGSSHCVFLSPPSAKRIAAQLDAMGIVDDAVEDGIGESWVADQVVPAVHGIWLVINVTPRP